MLLICYTVYPHRHDKSIEEGLRSYLIVAYIAEKARCCTSHDAGHSEWCETVRQIGWIVEDQTSNDEEEDEEHLDNCDEVYCVSADLDTPQEEQHTC